MFVADPRLEARTRPCSEATGCGDHMAFPSWEAGGLPMEPAGFPQADWPRRIGDIPTLGRGITLAMPCVGLDAWKAAMVDVRWPGPYMVKYAFDIDRDVAVPRY